MAGVAGECHEPPERWERAEHKAERIVKQQLMKLSFSIKGGLDSFCPAEAAMMAGERWRKP